jgi:hypothetical protein
MESRELLHPAGGRSARLAICPLANPLETPWIAGIFPDRWKARRRIGLGESIVAAWRSVIFFLLWDQIKVALACIKARARFSRWPTPASKEPN